MRSIMLFLRWAVRGLRVKKPSVLHLKVMSLLMISVPRSPDGINAESELVHTLRLANSMPPVSRIGNRRFADEACHATGAMIVGHRRVGSIVLLASFMFCIV